MKQREAVGELMRQRFGWVAVVVGVCVAPRRSWQADSNGEAGGGRGGRGWRRADSNGEAEGGLIPVGEAGGGLIPVGEAGGAKAGGYPVVAQARIYQDGERQALY